MVDHILQAVVRLDDRPRPRVREHAVDRQLLGNVHELWWRIVVERDACWKTRRQSRVALQKLVHFVAIPREDDDRVATVLLRFREEHFNGLLRVVVAAGPGHERVSL